MVIYVCSRCYRRIDDDDEWTEDEFGRRFHAWCLSKTECFEVIKHRRSIRKYKPTPVPEELLNRILEAARIAPSATNRQPWHFIIVKNPEVKRKLDIPRWAKEAPIIIVGCADPRISPRTHIIDTSIAFQHIILAATSLGLGSCWIGKLGADQKIKEVLNIPPHIKVIAVTPIGFAAEKPPPKGRKHIGEITTYI